MNQPAITSSGSLPSTTEHADSPSLAAQPVATSAVSVSSGNESPSVGSASVDLQPAAHPENRRESSDKEDKPVLSASDSTSEDVDSAEGEGELDDDAFDEDDDDALISTASFQNGDEVIVMSSSSPYNGERARIVDIRGDKLMVSVKDEQLVLTVDEVKSLHESLQGKAMRNKNVRTSTRIRHQSQPMSAYQQADKQNSAARRTDRPKRDAAGNAFGGSGKGASAPRSRNNSKAMLGKRVAIVGGRNKGERGRVTKGANGYFTIILERSSTNPSSNTQVMKRSHDLKVIDGSGDFPIPHRRAANGGSWKKNKSRQSDYSDDDMDEDKGYEDESSDREDDTRSTKRIAWANGYSTSRSRSRSASPSFSSSHSEMESEPLSDSDSSLVQSDDEHEAVSRRAVKSKTVANVEREAAHILMDILQARANSQPLKRHYGEKAHNEQNVKRSRTFTYDHGNQVADASNQPMLTEEYGARSGENSHPNLNVVIAQEDHQFYTPLLSSTSALPSHHASPAIAPVVDESKLYPSSPFATQAAPLQLTSAQNSPSMKAMNAAAAANASMVYQKAITTPTHSGRTQFFPPTPRSPLSKAVILPATPNGAYAPQAFARVVAPAMYQGYPSPIPQPLRGSPNQIPFAVNRAQMTILSTAASTVL